MLPPFRERGTQLNCRSQQTGRHLTLDEPIAFLQQRILDGQAALLCTALVSRQSRRAGINSGCFLPKAIAVAAVRQSQKRSNKMQFPLMGDSSRNTLNLLQKCRPRFWQAIHMHNLNINDRH